MRKLGASVVVDDRKQNFEDVVPEVDIVLDAVGGETRERSMSMVKPGGILVSAVPGVAAPSEAGSGVRTGFFLGDVTTERLDALTRTDMPLAEVRTAHEMLAGRGDRAACCGSGLSRWDYLTI